MQRNCLVKKNTHIAAGEGEQMLHQESKCCRSLQRTTLKLAFRCSLCSCSHSLHFSTSPCDNPPSLSGRGWWGRCFCLFVTAQLYSWPFQLRKWVALQSLERAYSSIRPQHSCSFSKSFSIQDKQELCLKGDNPLPTTICGG